MYTQIIDYVSNLRYYETFTASLTMNISFFLACYWIYKNQVSGNWEKYRIKVNAKEEIDYEKRKEIYKSQVPGVMFYLGFVMTLVFLITSNYIFTECSNVFVDLLKTFLSYVITRCWSFLVHVLMHMTSFFSKYHKEHHVPISELTPVSTFSNSMFEFLNMEAFAWVIGMSLVGGLPLYCCILLGVYNFVNGAMDHSGFCLDSFWFNGIYHYVHHIEPTSNYAQFSFLDIINGTYKDYPMHQVVQAFKPKPTPVQSVKPQPQILTPLQPTQQ